MHTDNGTKLGSNFNIKDIAKKQHKQDLMCSARCPEKTGNETYNGEPGKRLVERTDEHR